MAESFRSVSKIFVVIARPDAFVKGCTYKALKKYDVLEPGISLTTYPLSRKRGLGIFGKVTNVITGIRVVKPDPNRTYCPFMNLLRDIIFTNFTSTEIIHDEDAIFGTLDTVNWNFHFRRYIVWTPGDQRKVVDEHDAVIIMNRDELGDLQREREHNIQLVFGDDFVQMVGEHRNEFHERVEDAREALWRDGKCWQKVAYLFQSNMELNAYDPDMKYCVQ